MRILPSLVAVSLALSLVAISRTEGRAQAGPESHPYCALDENGGTDCYYDSRQGCGARCIDNPSYAGGGAMARGHTAAPRRSHR